MSYNRIEDNKVLEVTGKSKESVVRLGKNYTAVTYNIGFGAYTPDFTFFMDGGKSSWAKSKESVISCINGSISLLKDRHVDFALLQEVDFNSTRSYHVNEVKQIIDAFNNMSSTLAISYHSAFLFWPIFQPHGFANSGLLTLSKVNIESSIRRSLPVSESLSKFFDLDRCYSINRILVENSKELVIINVHLSAYGTNKDLQRKQLEKLFFDMKEEYKKGNYVICAGDFNMDFFGNSKEIFNKVVPGDDLTWASPFPNELIPEHFLKLTNYNKGIKVPSCRNSERPYGPDSLTLIVDGFIVSDNINIIYTDIIDNHFAYSDHNPVEIKFNLI